MTYAPFVRVRFSQPLAKHWSHPTLTPSIPGSWERIAASTIEFRPLANFVPFSKVTLVVGGGANGVRDDAGATLATPYHASFTIEGGSTLRLQQLLAELGYLPLDFVDAPSSQLQRYRRPLSSTKRLRAAANATLDSEATQAGTIGLSPAKGSFSWRYSDIPTALAATWQPGVDTVLVRGAVMAFESAHGLGADGVAGPQVWSALLDAVAHRDVSKAPYDYIEVRMTTPERLYVWQNGKVIYQSLANTGIPQAPTTPGTFPVYLRYASTTMSGFNPHGSHYDDPGVPYVAYFNGGDAVHGFLRAQYGYPQSLGCVELPYANAAVVFNDDPLGTLVNVS